MNIRKMAYWTLDGLKSSPVRNKYMALKESDGSGNGEALTEILKYARSNVPYYQNIADDALAVFPVVDKSIIRENYDLFRSEEYLDDSKLITLYTSGSSGTPFKAFQNREKDQHHKAALIRQNESIGWDIGDRWAHLRNWGFGKSATRFACFKKNMVPISALDLDEKKLEQAVETIVNDKKLHILFGYSSALERLANYIVEKGYQDLDFGIKLIMADSDNLKSESWDLLEDIFKCPVVNRYGSIENGIFALTMPNDRTFYVDTTQFYIELLKMGSDESVEEGELGRVVITDLHNKALPFIRYYIGDLAIAKKIVDGQCIEIASLQGREITALKKTDGTLLSETNIMGHFKRFTAIDRYQIIQRSETSYLMRIECKDPGIDEACISECKLIFGDDALVTVEHADHIDCEKNEKFRVTVSEI